MEHDEVLVSNGKDGLQSVKELETRYKSVCFLQSVVKVYDIHKKTNKEKIKRSTGFYAKVKLDSQLYHGVFTNNHVLSSEGEAKKTTATFGYDDTNQGKTVQLRPTMIFRTNKVLDYTFVGIYKEEVEDLQLGISPVIFDDEAEVEVDDDIFIFQHPKGRPKEFSHEKVMRVEKPFVYYKADTDTGSSGSPVFKKLELIAVHHKGNEEELYNKGTLCSEILSHLKTGKYTVPAAAIMDSQDKEIYEGKRCCDCSNNIAESRVKQPKLDSTSSDVPVFKCGCPTTDELCSLSKEIIAFWKFLARGLKLERSKIQEISRDHINYPDISEKAFAMLEAWLDKGDCTTYVALGNALTAEGHHKLAKAYCFATDSMDTFS